MKKFLTLLLVVVITSLLWLHVIYKITSSEKEKRCTLKVKDINGKISLVEGPAIE